MNKFFAQDLIYRRNWRQAFKTMAVVVFDFYFFVKVWITFKEEEETLINLTQKEILFQRVRKLNSEIGVDSLLHQTNNKKDSIWMSYMFDVCKK